MGASGGREAAGRLEGTLGKRRVDRAQRGMEGGICKGEWKDSYLRGGLDVFREGGKEGGGGGETGS